MEVNNISNVTITLNHFNNAFEFSGLSTMQDTAKKLSESIKCNIKPLIDLANTWNKPQKVLLECLKPALDNISELSNKVSESLKNIPTITTFDSIELTNAFKRYNDIAAPCLYTSSEIVLSPEIGFLDEQIATKNDIQELRAEVERLNLDLLLYKRENNMNPNEFSDEAEYIYALIYKHYEKKDISNHSLMIEMDEFSSDLNESAFELGLKELQAQRFLGEYKSFNDGSYHIDLCLRCTNSLREGKVKLTESENNIITKKRPAILTHVMAIYPEFEKDYDILLSNEYFEETENGLHWRKKKQCLAEYFGDQNFPNKWSLIEKLFNETNLKALYNNKEYESKDYQELKILLKK